MSTLSTTHAPSTLGATCHHRVRRCPVVAGGVFAILLWASSLWAGTGLTVQMPRGNRAPKSGLRMKVDLNWVSGAGYRPVRIELASVTGPVKADRSLRFEISPAPGSGYGGQVSVARDIEIPEGSAGVVETLSLPQSQVWREVSFRVWEDGVQIEELSSASRTISDSQNWTEAIPKALFVHRNAPTPEERRSLMRQVKLGYQSAGAIPGMDDLPDLRSWRAITQSALTRGVPPANASTVIDRMQLVDESPWFELLPPQYLTKNWIDLTSFDLILLSQDDLQLMKSRYPAQFNALRTVISTGSILCVWGAGDDFERLGDLEQLLESPPVNEQADDEPFRGWSVPDRQLYGRRLSSLPDILGNGSYVETETGVWELRSDDVQEHRKSPSRQPATKRPPFVYRDMDLGTVVAIASDDPFPGDTAFWYWMLNSLDQDDWQTYRRHGLSFERDNDDYWNFLIPGVGAAPVMAFRILITLFVIVIGPVNYWLLSRWGRLHLLLVTVPVGAFLVTSTLFLYAVLSDGLGVRARVRSFTLLDQTRGRCVSWSRQSYYAGLAPSEGLVFPRGAVVYPLHQYPVHAGGQDGTLRQVDWDDKQRLTRGWLRSRVITQFLVVNADESQIGLNVKPADDLEKPPEITNALGSRIVHLALRDEAGEYYAAKDIAGGAVFHPAATDRISAEAAIRSSHVKNRPVLPYRDGSHGYGYQRYGRRPYYGYYGGMDQGLPEPTVFSSVLERNLMLAGNSDFDLEKRSYVAVVERTSAVPIGTDVEEEASYHVLRGRW